jgi:hypothetical protein
MLFTTYAQAPCHAPVESFSLLRGRILCGKRLRDVQALQESIVIYGLLSPIIVMKQAEQLIVVDGRKRLAAIKRLQFKGRLPPSFRTIPYLLATDLRTTERPAPLILANEGLYDAVIERFQAGEDVDALTTLFSVSHQCVRDILTLSRLTPRIRAAFFNKTLSFPQARAFAALPAPCDQDFLFNKLSSLATPNDILSSGVSQAAISNPAIAA